MKALINNQSKRQVGKFTILNYDLLYFNLFFHFSKDIFFKNPNLKFNSWFIKQFIRNQTIL